VYPDNISERCRTEVTNLHYLVAHQIESGLSYGVFDDNYEFKNPDSKERGIAAGIPEGGHLWWDASEPSIEVEQGRDAEAKRLEDQMDFPLVSVALSYDGFTPLDPEGLAPVLEALPLYGHIYGILAALDPRDPESWGPTGPNQVLMRNATSTKNAYGGQGLMPGLARWLMREASALGWRGIQIECLHDAVTKVWSQPLEPFRGSVVSEFHTGTWVDEEGKILFEPAQQRVTKCFVELVPEKKA
jgi:hypothetical protein